VISTDRISGTKLTVKADMHQHTTSVIVIVVIIIIIDTSTREYNMVLSNGKIPCR
jgi:hypothetical protein